jgi:hypothetical protein
MDNLKTKLYTIIFETDTRAGKIFDITLLVIILLSVFLVILDSVPEISKNYHDVLVFLELAITGVFTLEYILRIIIVKRPLRYIFSFYGIIDFLAVIPTYLGLLTSGYHRLLVIRSLRLLRESTVFDFFNARTSTAACVSASPAHGLALKPFFETSGHHSVYADVTIRPVPAGTGKEK